MKPVKLKSKDLLTVTDLSKNEIINIFEFAAKLKKEHLKGKNHKFLKRKSLAMIFEKCSTRTRVSFETGIFQLAGHSLFLDGESIQIGRGETLADTAKVLSRYVDGILIRTDSHEKAIELSQNSFLPIINGLTDTYHPCQALTDFFTIFERENDYTKVKVVYIGDGNNMANSLLLCAAVLGANITIISPKKYSPPIHIVEEAYKLSTQSGAQIHVTPDIDLAVKDADYIYTDVWASMGQEKNAAKKKKSLSKYKISKKLLNKCSDNCRVMHCLPAHRGEEIDSDVIDSEQSIVFDQAENRLHVQKAIMCSLMR